MKRIWPKLVNPGDSLLAHSVLGRQFSRAQHPQLHWVPWNRGTGLYGRAATGRTKGAIHRVPSLAAMPRMSATIRFRNNICGAPPRILIPTRCGISRIILPRCHRDPPMMDVGRSWNGDKRFTSRESGSQYRGMRRLPRLGRPGCARDSASRRNVLFLPQAPARGMGPRNHSAVGSPMPLVVGTLGPDEIEALASYLSFVK